MKAEEKAMELYPDWQPVSKKVDSLGFIVVMAERQAYIKGYEDAKQQPEVDYQKMFANCSLPNEKQPEQDKVREAAEKVVCLYDSDCSKTKDHERVFDEAMDELRKALNQNKQR